MARHSQPHLIILDMLLPKLGGELVLRSLKQDPTTTSIPVIVVSSLPQSNAEKLRSEGATIYIEKSKLDLMTSGEKLLWLVNAVLHTFKARGLKPQRCPDITMRISIFPTS